MNNLMVALLVNWWMDTRIDKEVWLISKDYSMQDFELSIKCVCSEII